MGRPKLPPDQKRSAKAFYVTPAEAEYLRQCLVTYRETALSMRPPIVVPVVDGKSVLLAQKERPFTPMLKDKWVKK